VAGTQLAQPCLMAKTKWDGFMQRELLIGGDTNDMDPRHPERVGVLLGAPRRRWRMCSGLCLK
jgi:hypothetical protein